MICYVLLTSMQMDFKNNRAHNAFDSVPKQQKKKKIQAHQSTSFIFIY